MFLNVILCFITVHHAYNIFVDGRFAIHAVLYTTILMRLLQEIRSFGYLSLAFMIK